MMKRQTSVTKDSRRFARKAHAVLLSLLVLVAVCPGGQRQPQAPPQVQPPGQPAQPQPPGQRQPQQPQVARARRAPLTARLKTIQLPEPTKGGGISLEQALAGQRSTEPPGSQRLEFAKVGQLAWAMQGATAPQVPDASAPAKMPVDMNPMKVYFVLPDGVYLYNPADHSLEQASDGDVREALAAALLKQPGAPTGGCQVLVAASTRDFAVRYGARARTVMLLQAGRMAQSMQLQAAALGLTFIGIEDTDAGGVRRITHLSRNLDPLYVAFVGYPASKAPQTPTQEPVPQRGRAALMVVPVQGFRDEELFETKRALELAGVQVLVASSRSGTLLGALGGTAQADLLLNQAKVDDFDAVIFVGGTGAVEYFSNPVAHNLVRQAFARQRVLAAIGTAPSILANAGVLRGTRATAFISEQGRVALGGAVYTGAPMEKDGLIITATGPLAAPVFARAILEALGEGGR